MKYDVASKRLVELSGKSILRELLKIDIGEFEIIQELPQQTVSLRSSDFPLMVRDQKGDLMIILLEFQTRWDEELPLRVGEYLIRFQRKHRLPVIPVVLLFREHPEALDRYESEFLRVSYHLVRVWEIGGEELLGSGDLFLLPLVGAARSGRAEILEAERRIYESELERGVRADLLAILTIFAGFKDRELVEELLRRRRDIMIESIAYEIIKEEGMREGMREGIEKGELKASKEMVVEALEERFSVISAGLVERINEIGRAVVLRGLLRQAMRCESLEEFEAILKKAR